MSESDLSESTGENTLEPEESDEALVQRVQAGDTDAYDQLVQRHQGKIYGLVYNMTGNQQDAQDLVQDVFIKGHKVLKRFKGKSSFYTWIYRIAINRTINFIKKRRNRHAASLDAVDHAVESDPAYIERSGREGPLRDVTLTELQERLNTALQSLSEKHRTVVILHDIQGVAHDEIGRMIGCSPGTVRSRLYYARQQLQAELAEFAP